MRPADRALSLVQSLATGIPFQVAWYYSKALARRLAAIADEIKPDHVYCQLPRMAEYVRSWPHAKTLDYMDSFGVSMLRRSHVARWPFSWIYRWEGARMLRYEEVISHHFDHLTIISRQDKDSLRFSGADRIEVVPNGIDGYFLDCVPAYTSEFDMVFIGNLSYLPNIETAEYLVNRILPLCPKGTTVLLAGASPQHRVMSLAGTQVTVEGWSADIRTQYSRGRVFVAPMWSGTGQQNKIMEAMALGIPCITTEAVNNAIGAIPDKEILLADSPDAFVSQLTSLLSDSTLYENIRGGAARFVRSSFDWEQNGRLLSFMFAKTKMNDPDPDN
jgi:glycosyltransferase involved in cell wall biosynthesis